MYSNQYQKRSYWKEISEVPHNIGERIPTFEKTLDSYFDRHFEEVVAEWELLSEYDLRDLEKRLDNVTLEIERLSKGRETIEERAANLDAELEKLEWSE